MPISGGGASAAEIWAYATRVLTQIALKKYSIHSDILHSHDAEVSGTEISYIKKKTITLNTLRPNIVTIRISFEIRTENASYAAYGRIYKNGVAVGTERSTISTTYTAFSEDLEFKEGDTLELWTKGANVGYFHYARNFRVQGREINDYVCDDPFVATNS